MTQATFALRGRNPDVLTCIANLSNDEVFTPPEFANEMLDALERTWAAHNEGANIWSDSSVTFLDPAVKTGVFLREIVARLNVGLEGEISDLHSRINHILTKQVFGIGITNLTALMSRRTLYCSKIANGKHSICSDFESPSGNVWFQQGQHIWAGDRCGYCGANREILDRDDELETHAYTFIHTNEVSNRMHQIYGENVQFDVIIGNPPYQLSDGGHGASATAIYQKFVKQAFELNPRYVSMVIPSRWFSGGRGLGQFRNEMLTNGHVRRLTDFIVEKDAFPRVNINGGVCYFVWDRDHPGSCEVTTVTPGGFREQPQERPLDEFDVFIRRNEAVSILRKVKGKAESTFEGRVSNLRPFGLRTHFHGLPTKSSKAPIKLFGSGKVSWISEAELLTNVEWASLWKVLIPRATDGNENYPLPIWDQAGPFVSGPGEACTETYLVASLAENSAEAERIAQYMRTKFFRFMVSLRKITQDNKSDLFSFVPDLPMNKTWDDEALFKRYGLTAEEIAHVDLMIRDVNFANS